MTGASAKRLSLIRSISAVASALRLLVDMPKNRPWKYRFSNTGQAAVERVGLRDDADDPLGPSRAGRPRRCRRPTPSPQVGITRVVSIPAVVDLPAPFGPSRPKISPWCTVRSRSSTAQHVGRVHLGEMFDSDGLGGTGRDGGIGGGGDNGHGGQSFAGSPCGAFG